MKRYLPPRILCLVTDLRLAGGASGLVSAVELALRGGVNMVQLREKELPRDEFLDIARRLHAVTAGRAPLLVNTGAGAALDADFEGVQLPESGAPLRGVREAIGHRRLIGRSVHSVEGGLAAERDGADFLILGTVFPSRTHPGGEATGVAGIAAVCAAVTVPVIGIGGITAENAAEVVNAGARGVAVVSAILASDDPEQAAADLAEAIGLE